MIELLTDYEIIVQSRSFIRHLDSSVGFITNPIGRKVPIRFDSNQSVPVKCRIINFSNALDGNNLSDDYFKTVKEINDTIDIQKDVKKDVSNDILKIPICETTGNYCIPVKQNQLLLGTYSISGGSEIKIPDKDGQFFNTNFVQGLVSIHSYGPYRGAPHYSVTLGSGFAHIRV